MSQVLADSRNLVGVKPHSPSSQIALYHNILRLGVVEYQVWRGSSMAEQSHHKAEVAGSTPAPATKESAVYSNQLAGRIGI